jgi:hypothetical protein
MRLLLIALFLDLLTPAHADDDSGFDHTYAQWDTVLRGHVDGKGRVNYAGLKGNADLAAFLKQVAEISPEVVAGWSRDKQVAFYSNAYNALTFQTILDANIPASIRDIKPDPWEAVRWTVAGRTVSLNWLEHTKLRKNLNEPRVHFVLVCAAVGCPTLPNRALRPDGLSTQLERAARAFFNDPGKNRVDVAGKTVHLSKILEWYGGDFEGLAGNPEVAGTKGLAEPQASVVRYLSKYVGDAERAVLNAGGFTIAWNDYDWSLNKQ